MVQSMVLLGEHSPDEARKLADAAYRQFAVNDEMESEWESLLDVAQAAAEQGDYRSAQETAKRSLDILKKIEQQWGSPTYTAYQRRTDIGTQIKELQKLAAL
jgi:hypothetical protein